MKTNMRHSSNCPSDTSDFCQLGSKFTICFAGSLVDCVPNIRSRTTGTILTRKCEIVSRCKSADRWETVTTPSMYLFYDNDTEKSFMIDSGKCSMKKVRPCGKILDCTNKIIYEVRHDEWHIICDLNQKNHTVTSINSIAANENTFSFEFFGSDPTINEFSEITSDEVSFNGTSATIKFNSAGQGSIPDHGSVTLILDVIINCEHVSIVKIFIRQSDSKNVPRISARGGQIIKVPTNNVPAPITVPIFPLQFDGTTDSLGGLLSPTLDPGSTARAYTIGNWVEIYDKPVSGTFNHLTGNLTVSTRGDYLVNSQVSYSSPTIIHDLGAFANAQGAFITYRNAVPYFALVLNNFIVDIKPATADLLSVNFQNLGVAPFPNNGTAASARVFLATLGIPTINLTDVELIQVSIAITAAINADIIARKTFYHLASTGTATISTSLTLKRGDRLSLIFVDPLHISVTGPQVVPLPTIITTTVPRGYQLIPLGTTFNVTFLGSHN